MAQFDVFRTRAAVYPFVVDVQAEVHTRLTTRIVVPMVALARYAQPVTRLTPVLKIRDVDHVLMFPLLAAVPKASLGERVDSLATHRAILIGALDLLIAGS